MFRKLKEAERAQLSELYLKRQLILNDLEKLQDLLRAVDQEIRESLKRIVGSDKLATVRPVFEQYRLVGLEVQDGTDASEERS